VILSVFIAGITLGSFIVYRKSASITNPYKWLTYCQVGIVAATLFTIPFYDALPYYIWSAVGAPGMSSYTFYLIIQLFFVVLLILPPTIFMGMSLPLASRMYVKDVKESGRGIGNIFAFNTLGTVLGSLLAGLALIPFVGIKNTLQIAVAVNLILAILLYRKGADFKRSHLLISGATLLIGLFFYLGTVRQQRWAYHIMLSEISRKINRIEAPLNFEEFMEKAANHEQIHFYKEGVNGTIVVAENDGEVYLFTNGKGDANSVGDLSTQISLGLTPVVLHPAPDSVFVIGFGAGTTIGHVMSHPRVKYGEVAEISSEVIEASSYFNKINGEPLKRKNLKVIQDDGLCALRVSPRKYDVIISQPSNPWSAGVGNLFTKEFFHTCKEHLHKDGFVAQWFNMYEMDDESMRLVLRTALSEFKKITLWHLGGSDILLLCSDHDLGMKPEQFRAAFELSAKEFSKINIHAFPAFLSQEVVSDQQVIRKYAGNGPLNTEDLPLLEHWAPRAYYYNSSPSAFYALDERGNLDAHPRHLLGQLLRSEKGLSKEEILQTGLFQSLGGNKDLAHQLADMNPEIYSLWAEKARQMGNMTMAKEYDDRAAALMMANDPSKSDAERRADQLARSGNQEGALNEIQKALKLKETAGLYFQKGNILLSQGKTDECMVAFEKAIQLDPKLLEAYINLAIAKGQKSLFPEVVEILNRAEKLSTNNAQVYFNRGYAYALQDKYEASLKDFNKAITINPNYGQAYLLRGRTYQTMGKIAEACADYQKAASYNVQGAAQMVQQTCR
jgi:spermidine synthase/tetratricopeptide (TPR) repeat protein